MMKTRAIGRTAAMAVLLAAATIAPLRIMRTEAHTMAAFVPRCTNSQLTIQPLRSSGAAGHIGEMFRIHNLLAKPCTLYGYPGAILLDKNFFSLTTRVARGFSFLAGPDAPVTVTLVGGHNGYFIVEWTHFPSPGQTCPPASYIMITAPNDRLPVVTYAGMQGSAIDACGGNLTVSPVAPNAFSF